MFANTHRLPLPQRTGGSMDFVVPSSKNQAPNMFANTRRLPLPHRTGGSMDLVVPSSKNQAPNTFANTRRLPLPQCTGGSMDFIVIASDSRASSMYPNHVRQYTPAAISPTCRRHCGLRRHSLRLQGFINGPHQRQHGLHWHNKNTRGLWLIHQVHKAQETPLAGGCLFLVAVVGNVDDIQEDALSGRACNRFAKSSGCAVGRCRLGADESRQPLYWLMQQREWGWGQQDGWLSREQRDRAPPNHATSAPQPVGHAWRNWGCLGDKAMVLYFVGYSVCGVNGISLAERTTIFDGSTKHRLEIFCREELKSFPEDSVVADICLESSSSSTYSHHLATMPLKANKGGPKSKEMFKAYNTADVPDVMPLPVLANVASTKGEETAVPKLNDFQHSWILDVGIRGVDLPSLTGKAASELYDRVKHDVFDAKAFQHTAQPQDTAEEATLAALIADWKKKHPKKAEPCGVDDSNVSDNEEDKGGHAGLLRRYTKSGWHLAIQKVMSNKHTAEKGKRATNLKGDPGEPTTTEASATATAMSKLLGLAAFTGHDKFREDHHDEIHKYSKGLAGVNAGGKFHQAEALLWVKEDQASWDAVAMDTGDVDWTERQKLVANGFKNMVNNLHTSGKFRPFMATMLMAWIDDKGKLNFEAEAVPRDIHVRQPFEKQYSELVECNVNSMYSWAEKPLKDYVATLKDSSTTPPLFPLTVDALDDVLPKMLAQTVSTFLIASYEAAFGSQDVPWAAIASSPNEYYNTGLPLRFTATGLTDLKRNKCLFPRCGVPYVRDLAVRK
ncbi:hypothetical protein C8J57DRAFT_1492358 [Mycena rebaudengoi]|nr:hypothetical protein C8J57DRAFT_1492358 [Mycena rebaudengoi]